VLVHDAAALDDGDRGAGRAGTREDGVRGAVDAVTLDVRERDLRGRDAGERKKGD
jgi:hypothetical protein